MRADIGFYLNGTVEERLLQLTTLESPLRLGKKDIDFYILHAQDPILDHFFIYGRLDSEIMSEYSLHIEAQKALSFQSGSCLNYNGCNLNLEKVAAFRKIMQYLATNNIPVYMTATNESGDEVLVRGYNPITNVEIQNLKIKFSF